MASTEDNEESPAICFETVLALIRSSKKYNILVYGLNNHLNLLSGILGKEISPQQESQTKFSFQKNGITVEIHVGSHDDCIVNHEAIDLLLYFIPLYQAKLIEQRHIEAINRISTKHGKEIWNHSVILITGADEAIHSFQGRIVERFETLLQSWTTQIQQALESEISAGNQVLIVPTGRIDEPDLPKPHLKWFSRVWNACFFSSKVESMPACLKVAQDRIQYGAKKSECAERGFFDQPIVTDRKGLSPQNRAVLGVAGGGAVAGGAVVGATVGAVIGALAIGIPSFGVAAGAGLVIGGVVGGSIGAGVVGASIGGGVHAYKKRKSTNSETEQLNE